jgi:hypothetical protein
MVKTLREGENRKKKLLDQFFDFLEHFQKEFKRKWQGWSTNGPCQVCI